MDIAAGSYGEVPDHPGHRSMAPRGSDVDPDTPDMGYILNDKSDVWADNVLELYEEAVARQWSATRDIPWSELPELPDDIEHAICQDERAQCPRCCDSARTSRIVRTDRPLFPAVWDSRDESRSRIDAMPPQPRSGPSFWVHRMFMLSSFDLSTDGRPGARYPKRGRCE